MNRREEVGSCSGSSVVHHNPERFSDFTAESSSGSVKNSKFCNHGGGSIEFRLISNVKLNGEPFYDFFALNDAKVSRNNTSQICLDFTPSSSPSPPSPPRVANLPLVVVDTSSTEPITEAEPEPEPEPVPEPALEVMPLNVYIPDDAVILNRSIAVSVDVAAVEWKVRKVLRKSDCDEQHRLMISRQVAEDHILKYLDGSRRGKVESTEGLMVKVFDCDTKTWVEQTLKIWRSISSLTMMKNWRKDFVVRRGLKIGDEVGLCWANQHQGLLFTILRRSPAPVPVPVPVLGQQMIEMEGV